jgi:hypothetical protein
MAISKALIFFQHYSTPSQGKIPAILFCLFVLSGQSMAQPKTDIRLTDTLFSKERVKHEALETELEIYPFNMVVPNDPVIKNEAMFDYHLFFKKEKLLGGIRFFADANTHWAKARDMKDLILYTEIYYGFKNFQIGAETGSVTGQEYLSLGPQFTHYDSKLFKRASLVSRVLPDYVLGYEFTTQEANLSHNMKISSTGMGRIVLPSNQTVIQASIWVSFKNIRGIYFGMEYEYNNAAYFGNFRFETNHELFFGLKAELH